MPRRDGQATNREMLADFTTASRDLFITLYDLGYGDHFPPALEGKPLSALSAYVLKRYFPDNRLNTSVHTEELSIRPLQHLDVDIMRDACLQTRHFSPDVFNYYESIASNIAEVALRSALNLHKILPSNGVTAEYIAHYPNKTRRHVGTLKDMPAKIPIAAAQYLTEEAKRYALSGDSTLSLRQNALKAQINGSDGVITHTFRVEIEPYVPLNGYESTEFLLEYRDTMKRWHRLALARIEKFSSLAPSMIDDFKRQAAEYKAAADRAQAILDAR